MVRIFPRMTATFSKSLSLFLISLLCWQASAELPCTPFGEVATYVVKEGEDFLDIAHEHRLAIDHLTFANCWPQTATRIYPDMLREFCPKVNVGMSVRLEYETVKLGTKIAKAYGYTLNEEQAKELDDCTGLPIWLQRTETQNTKGEEWK